MPIKGYDKQVYELIEMQKYSNVGSVPFPLIAYRDPCLFLRRDLHVYEDENGEVELQFGADKDWIYGAIDILYRDDDFTGETVYGSLKMLNPDYQNTDIWITYYRVGDYTSAEMFNRFDRALDQMLNSIVTTQDAQVVINNSGNVVAQGELYPGYREEL